MQKRAWVVLVVVVFGAIGVMVWQMAQHPSEPEPTYKGKRLSALLKVTWVSTQPGGVGVVGNWEDIEQAAKRNWSKAAAMATSKPPAITST
jgi:hypothetical protein